MNLLGSLNHAHFLSTAWSSMEVYGEEESTGESEEAEEEGACPCLFCDAELAGASAVLAHCASEHGFDLLVLKSKHRECRDRSFLQYMYFI